MNIFVDRREERLVFAIDGDLWDAQRGFVARHSVTVGVVAGRSGGKTQFSATRDHMPLEPVSLQQRTALLDL